MARNKRQGNTDGIKRRMGGKSTMKKEYQEKHFLLKYTKFIFLIENL